MQKKPLAACSILLMTVVVGLSEVARGQTACGTCGQGSGSACEGTLKGCGRWTAVSDANWPTNDVPDPGVDTKAHAVHMVLARTGKVLFWKQTDTIGSGAYPHYWDPVSFTDVQLAQTPSDTSLFCAGHVVLSDGNVLIMGGQYSPFPSPAGAPVGTLRSTLFDPIAQTLTQRPNMSQRRWYPTGTVLPDERVLALSGWQQGNFPQGDADSSLIASIPEIYNGSWANRATAEKKVMSLYPFMHLDPSPNGTRLLYLGPGANPHAEVPPYFPLQTAQRIGDLNGTSPTWNNNVGSYQVRGHASVRYGRFKIMKSGGTQPSGGCATRRTEIATIDSVTGALTFSQSQDMTFGRAEHQLTILADGTVLATGGSCLERGGGADCDEGVLETELWDPTAGTNGEWRRVAKMDHRNPDVPRMYHSTALLLPDARVLSAGGDCRTNPDLDPTCPGYPNNECRSGDLYEPAYLFTSGSVRIDDALDRPQVSGEPTLVGTGGTFTLTVTPGSGSSLTKASFIRPGAVTHSNNMDQRYLSLAFSSSGNSRTVTAPKGAELAPPGYYMLFFVNNLGYPSTGKFVRVWGIIQSSVKHSNLQVLDGNRFKVTLDWDTNTAATEGEQAIFYPPPGGGGPFEITCTGADCVFSNENRHHSATFTLNGCLPGYWYYEVRSHTSGTTSQSYKTEATKFKIAVCIE